MVPLGGLDTMLGEDKVRGRLGLGEDNNSLGRHGLRVILLLMYLKVYVFSLPLCETFRS